MGPRMHSTGRWPEPPTRGQEIGGRCSGAVSAFAMTRLGKIAISAVADARASMTFATPIVADNADGHWRMVQAFAGSSCCCCSAGTSSMGISGQGDVTVTGGDAQWACPGQAATRPRTANINRQLRSMHSIRSS